MKTPLLISGIIFILLFSLSVWNKYSIENSLLYTGLFSLFFFCMMCFAEILGRRKHHNLSNWPAIQDLLISGFKVEEINNYRGVTGEYRGFIFDIYLDWSVRVRGKSEAAYIFNVYYTNPTNTYDELVKWLNAVSKKYKPGFWSKELYILIFEDNYVTMRNSIGFKKPDASKLKARMDVVVDMLIAEKVSPLGRKSLTELRTENPREYVPAIDTYWEE